MFRRAYWIAAIEEAWRRRSIVWLSGVRRSGKTVLSQSLSGVEYFDCELPRVRQSMADPESWLRALRGKQVVLDEVHRLANPSELLKIAADHFPDVRVLATGSSTLQATAKFRDTLTGRKVEVFLTPMMSADLEDFGDGDLVRRLTQGGLPPFYLASPPDEREFQEWMDSYWAKDIQELFRLARRASFMRFVELVVTQSGGIFEATKFATPCEVSRTTIANYLSILEATRVAHVVRPFSSHRRTEIVSAPRVYAFDTGFVTCWRGWSSPRPAELGILWEHYVLNEIQSQLPGVEVRYWRDLRHHEVDFVVARRGRSPVAIECKWSGGGDEDLSGLVAFRRAYPRGPNIVIAPGVERPYVRGVQGVQVEYVNLDGLIQRLG